MNTICTKTYSELVYAIHARQHKDFDNNIEDPDLNAIEALAYTILEELLENNVVSYTHCDDCRAFLDAYM